MSDKKIELGIHEGAGGILNLKIAGSLNLEESKSEIQKWIDSVKEGIQNLYKKNNKKVLCLVDITELKDYSPESITLLAELMKSNEPYVEKTATFGGNARTIIAEDVVIALSGRSNMRAFSEKEKAEKWLIGESEEKPESEIEFNV